MSGYKLAKILKKVFFGTFFGTKLGAGGAGEQLFSAFFGGRSSLVKNLSESYTRNQNLSHVILPKNIEQFAEKRKTKNSL